MPRSSRCARRPRRPRRVAAGRLHPGRHPRAVHDVRRRGRAGAGAPGWSSAPYDPRPARSDRCGTSCATGGSTTAPRWSPACSPTSAADCSGLLRRAPLTGFRPARTSGTSGGGVSERPKENASKAFVGASPPWVQIPPPPPAGFDTCEAQSGQGCPGTGAPSSHFRDRPPRARASLDRPHPGRVKRRATSLGCMAGQRIRGEGGPHDHDSSDTSPDGGSTVERSSGRPGGLRDHRRPGPGDDVPLAVPARAAGAARLPDRGRGRRRLDAGAARAAGPGLDRGHR